MYHLPKSLFNSFASRLYVEQFLRHVLEHNVTAESAVKGNVHTEVTDHIMPANLHYWLFVASVSLLFILLALGLGDWYAVEQLRTSVFLIYFFVSVAGCCVSDCAAMEAF